MRADVVPSGPKYIEDSEKIAAIAEGSLSFEELLVRLVECRYRLAVLNESHRAEATQPVLLISVEEDSPVRRSNNREENIRSFLRIPLSQITRRRIKTIPLKLQKLADMDAYCADPDFYDARDQRLKIRYDDLEDGPLAPASALTELVLSYALVPSGLAIIRQDLAENARTHAVRAHIKLELQYVSLEAPVMQEELLYVSLERAQRLVENRRKKME